MTEISLAEHRSRLSSLDTAGGRMAFLDLGRPDAPAVVLVHGMPTSSYLYRHVARHLTDRGLRVVAPDLLGFGASDKPRDRLRYATDEQARRLTALLDHLELASATFVAHDLGGPWTFEVADAQPERISSLVILNTSAYAELMAPPREARLVGGPWGGILAALMGSRLGRPMVEKFFDDFTAAGTALARDVVTAHWTPLHEGATRAFREFARNLDAEMSRFARYAAALRRLGVPASVVWGAEDPVLRPERLVPRFVADLAVRPEDVHVLRGASHFLQEDQPERVATLIGRFVESQAAGTETPAHGETDTVAR